MTLSGLGIYALVYFVFIVTPGPGIAAMIARGLGTGLRGAWPYALGFMLGDMTWFTLATLGLAALAQTFDWALAVVKYAGCAYLLYLAWKIWWAPPVSGDIRETQAVTAPWPSFFGAYSLTVGNPKVIVFFLSVLPLAVDVGHVTVTAWAAMLAVMVPFCPLLTFSVLYLAKRARELFRSATALQRINRGSAVLMAGAASVIGLRG